MQTILIVEDEDMVREIAALEFADAGFTVVEAADGAAALDYLAGGAPIDLLFTDIRLPGAVDGWTIARRARSLHPTLPVIYATGFPGDKVDVVANGVFVPKPYLPTAIVATARGLVAAG